MIILERSLEVKVRLKNLDHLFFIFTLLNYNIYTNYFLRQI